MKRFGLFLALILIFLASFVSTPNTAHADSCPSASGTGSGGFYIGQSITVPAGANIVVIITEPGVFVADAVAQGSTIISLVGSGTGQASASYTAPTAGTYNGVYGSIGGSFSWSISATFPGCNNAGPAGYFGPLFWDNRLNNKDGAETAAVFCDKGNVVIYGIGKPWKIVLKATPNDIDRVPSQPTVNTLIMQKGNYRLYRLTTGELQINAPGQDPKVDYWFAFNDCPRNEASH